ncbi:MAG TPA: glycosyl hydrolase, partial [Opitutaceae bacterium]
MSLPTMALPHPLRIALAAFLFSSGASAEPVGAPAAPAGAIAWPSPTRTARPWTRWWWLGSAVDAPNIERLLCEYRDAGLGGVEICPIYGAKGYEKRFIDYLSPQWMEMLSVTTRTAARLDMGVDLTTGTGWPMGGP